MDQKVQSEAWNFKFSRTGRKVSPLNVQNSLDDARSTPHKVAVCIVVGVFFLLLLRLWTLQIIRGEHYSNLSENNRFRLEDVIAPRGMIFDRQGRILVDNRPAFNLAIIPAEVKDPEKTLDRLREILNVDRSASMEKLISIRSGAPFEIALWNRHCEFLGVCDGVFWLERVSQSKGGCRFGWFGTHSL
jgi:hypothetical protein